MGVIIGSTYCGKN